MRLVKETEAHVLVRLLFLLLLLLGGRGVTTRGSGGSGSGSGVGVRVGNAVLELLNLGPAVLGLDGNRENLLIAVDEGVHDRGKGGVVGGQRDGSNTLDGRGQSLEELVLLNVEDVRAEGLAVVVHLSDSHTVGEGRDVQQVKERSLRGSDLAASLNELEVRGNFNGTTSNLGGDTESLEERGLTRFHTSVTGRNPDIARSNSTSTGRGSDTVGENLGTGLLEVTVGEDETNVACENKSAQIHQIDRKLYHNVEKLTLNEGKQTLVLRVLGNEALDGTANLKSPSIAIPA